MNNGLLGNKWDHNYFERLQLQIDGSIIDANGLGRNDRYLLNKVGNFVAPPELYTVLVHNPDGTYTLTYKNRTAKQFSSNGALQSIVDRHGNSLSFVYNGQGQLATVIDTLGRPIAYTYETWRRLPLRP